MEVEGGVWWVRSDITSAGAREGLRRNQTHLVPARDEAAAVRGELHRLDDVPVREGVQLRARDGVPHARAVVCAYRWLGW